MAIELSAVLGGTTTALFTFCYIPQIIKTSKTKTVERLSFWLLFISFVANIITLCYATLIHKLPLQVKYIGALIFLTICLYLHWKIWGLKSGSELKLAIPENSGIAESFP
jgi:uncharacterized protein with PQ loop repeat